MRHFVILLLTAAMLLSLSGCGAAEEDEVSYDEAYETGFEAGREFGYEEAAEKTGELKEESYQRVEKIIAMMDEIEVYTLDDIYDALCKTSEYILNFK